MVKKSSRHSEPENGFGKMKIDNSDPEISFSKIKIDNSDH